MSGSHTTSGNEVEHVSNTESQGEVHQRVFPGRNKQNQNSTNMWWSTLFPALTSGIVQSALLSPIDRALYLSVLHSRPFLRRENFWNPFQGVTNAVFYRIISGTSYLVWQDSVSTLQASLYRSTQYGEELEENMDRLVLGVVAGCLNGATLSPLQAVKHRLWCDNMATARSAAVTMHRLGGWKPFFAGLRMNVTRDAIFGAVYESLRARFRRCVEARKGVALRTSTLKSGKRDGPLVRQFGQEMFCNGTAAMLATVASSPFNYARNMQYSTPLGTKPLNFTKLIAQLGRSCALQQSVYAKMRFLQMRLVFGWGTLRVTLGMGLGQTTFDFVQSLTTRA